MSGIKWTHEQEQYLKENFANTSTQVLADVLGFSYGRTANKAFALKLKKNIELLKEHGRVNGKKSPAKFKKGNVPANKGKKMPAETYAKCKATMFKKCNEPHNTKFDGALTLRKHNRDGEYVYIRVAKAKWKPLQTVIYEKNYGPIPEGMKVIFKDKNRFNFSIDNLECVTCAELMERNSIHRFPEELQKTIRLTAKLKKQIEKQLNNKENAQI